MSTEKITKAEIFSERLESLRNGRKKVEFAAFLGTSPQNYGRYEKGRIPDSVSLSEIANRCGVTVDWLLGRDDSPPQILSAELRRTPAPKFEKGQELEKGELQRRGCVEVRKGSIGRGLPVSSCDLGGELAVVRERLAEVEGQLAYMSSQLDTVVGLLGHALGSSMDKARARAH